MDCTKSSCPIRTFDKPPYIWYNQATKYKEAFFINKHIYNEQNGLHYTLHGDVYLPDLTVSENEYKPLGKYGMMRRTYLKEQFPAKYNWMVWQDTLWPHLNQVDTEANDLFRTIVDQMAKARGVNEQLKADDQWCWIQEMGSIRNGAEEIVLREVVFS